MKSLLLVLLGNKIMPLKNLLIFPQKGNPLYLFVFTLVDHRHYVFIDVCFLGIAPSYFTDFFGLLLCLIILIIPLCVDIPPAIYLHVY